jgi:lipoprotein NlpI
MIHAMTLVLLVTFVAGVARDDSPETVANLLTRARDATRKGQTEEAIKLAGKAVALEPNNPSVYVFRAILHAGAKHSQEAIADFTKAIELDPKQADAYDRRGSEHFKLGHIAESIADFDKFLDLEPAETPKHWRRGIAYYYAGRFEEGWKQFKGYEQVDTNDVENAVWHYLCLARAVGPEKARGSMLKIGKDARVPLMEVYALFKGEAKPADVLAAIDKGKPSANDQNNRRFYAHLYLGLYYESIGDKKQTLEHMTKAVATPFPSYMVDVARVHLERLRQDAKAK